MAAAEWVRTLLSTHPAGQSAGSGAEEAPDWLLKFVIDQSHTAGLRAIPGSDVRETAKRASAWATGLQARRAEMLRTASECDDAEPGSGAYRRGVAQGIAEALSTDAPSDHDVRLAVVQFMRDMNAPEFEPADCAKLLASRLKVLASGKPFPDSNRTGQGEISLPHPLHGGKPYPAHVVLTDLAAQEGCDGEPYDTMQRLSAALAARPTAPESQGAWRLIDDEARDGKHWLVSQPGTKPIRAYFEFGRWWMHGAGRWRAQPADLTGAFEPTHYQPLPAPPVSSGQEG